MAVPLLGGGSTSNSSNSVYEKGNDLGQQGPKIVDVFIRLLQADKLNAYFQ